MDEVSHVHHIIHMLSIIGERWRSSTMRRWSSSIPWVAWLMHALIIGTTKGIVWVTVTIMLLTRLVTKIVDGLLPWRGWWSLLKWKLNGDAASVSLSF